MTVHQVGIGGFAATSGAGDCVRTLALGSCVAVVLLRPSDHRVGMVHVALPDSNVNPDQARSSPGHFADTGIPALFEAMGFRGAMPDPKSVIIKLVGGANVINVGVGFDIGRRNLLAIRKILWSKRMGAVAEDVGGTISRTVSVFVDDGSVRLSSPGRGDWEI